MDDTQTSDPVPLSTEALLEALESADPADAAEPAEQLARVMTERLEATGQPDPAQTALVAPAADAGPAR